jgi:beta-mannosidase
MNHPSESPDRLSGVSGWASLELRMETGNVLVRGHIGAVRTARVRCVLRQRDNVIHEERFAPDEFEAGVSFRDIPMRPWWPLGAGPQPLYRLGIELLDESGAVLDAAERSVGFRQVGWEGASKTELGRCVVNGQPYALRSADWDNSTPDAALRDRLETLCDQGINTLRVSGGLARDTFYAHCDELGLLVAQDFPLAALGAAPGKTEAERLPGQVAIARRLLADVQHHPSLLLWSLPPEATVSPALKAALADVVDEFDPTRRFLPGPFALSLPQGA